MVRYKIDLVGQVHCNRVLSYHAPCFRETATCWPEIANFLYSTLYPELTVTTTLRTWDYAVRISRQSVVFTARCTLVQSAVLRSHVVCLSVRPSVRL